MAVSIYCGGHRTPPNLGNSFPNFVPAEVGGLRKDDWKNKINRQLTISGICKVTQMEWLDSLCRPLHERWYGTNKWARMCTYVRPEAEQNHSNSTYR